MGEFQKVPEVVSNQPLYKINSGLEMVLTDEFIIKFKAYITVDQQTDYSGKCDPPIPGMV